MHGVILTGLKKFAIDQFDQQTWQQIQAEADIERTLFVPVTEYPDEYVYELVETAVNLSGIDQSTLLESFGTYVVPVLVNTYGIHINDDWDGLELIENVESQIHTALRAKTTGTFDPPEIKAERVDANHVVVEYGSDRGLCDVAVGILGGIGEFYDEDYEITETRCMHDGAEKCRIDVARTPEGTKVESVDSEPTESMAADGGPSGTSADRDASGSGGTDREPSAARTSGRPTSR